MENTNNSIFCKENAKCLIGFCLSLVCLIVCLVSIYVASAGSRSIIAYCTIPCSIVGFIVSAIGLFGLAKIKNHKAVLTCLSILGIVFSCSAIGLFITTYSSSSILDSLGHYTDNRSRVNDRMPDWKCDYTKDGCFEYEFSKDKTRATIVTYYWNGDPANTVINIPDKYSDDTQIVALGADNNRGLVGIVGNNMPNVFSILPEEKYVSISSLGSQKWSHDPSLNYESLVFTINIGKNVTLIDWSHYSDFLAGPYHVMSDEHGKLNPGYMTYQTRPYIAVTQEDGTLRGYHIFIRVNVDPDNPYYYSENGRMFHKSEDNTLIDFYYPYASSSSL